MHPALLFAAVEAQAVEIQTAGGWMDLAEEGSSGGLRSEMRGLPGLWGRSIRVRILGLNGEKKLEFNVPVGGGAFEDQRGVNMGSYDRFVSIALYTKS
jgi:hypothetical protein